jgi:hypothetical protein
MKDSDETTGLHLSLAQLLSYQQNQVTEEERDIIEEHFVHCRACTEQSIDLAHFLRPEEEEDATEAGGPAGLARVEPVVIWQKVRERAAPRPRPARAPLYERPRVLQAVAAALLAAAILAPLTIWQSAQRQLARFLEAEPNVAVVNLEAAAFRRDAGQPSLPPALVPPGALLVLLPERGPEKADHTVEILTAAGQQIDSKPGLRPTDLGQFHLRLPRNLSPGATYRIRIHYPRENHVEEFLVQVAAPAAR